MSEDNQVQIDTRFKEIEVEEARTPDVPEQEWKPSREVFQVLFCLSVIGVMASLDMTIFLPILPIIAEELNGDATSTFWRGSAYLVPCAGFQPIMASLSDIFGRRKMLVASLDFFVIGSIVGCVAHNMTTLLAGRVIQGIGGGGLIPLVTIISTDMVPLRQRPKFLAIVQASMALGTILGAPNRGLLCGSYELLNRMALGILYQFPAIGSVRMYDELYYLSLYLQSVKFMSAIMNGVGVFRGLHYFQNRTVPLGPLVWLDRYFLATGVSILLQKNTRTASWIFIFAFVGFGHGILYNALLIAAQACSPAKDVAYAGALYIFFRTLGFAIGVIIGGTVLQNFMATRLSDLGLPTDIAHNAEGYVSTLRTLPVGSALRKGVTDAYVYGLDGIFEVMTGIGALGLLATPFVASRTMDKSLETDHTIHGAKDEA
ncbi:efflux pump antibiotic resistance protein [Penicillium malachiteum]|uniref:efflux pump antibiotic resistance protein n=1 Tax=Penicillium malachiteum TaxID=1324776 RepID=UPI0025472FAE|nr:efflux pump antibiotic resistance protein [Penicillium malachiteum]KAJ5725818.1 efflux pump antibiotic resistance protein [Penicillium malachiteum]